MKDCPKCPEACNRGEKCKGFIGKHPCPNPIASDWQEKELNDPAENPNPPENEWPWHLMFY